MRDVCLVVEGSYPRVTGGVAQWAHDLVTGMPSLSFSVAALVPEDAPRLPHAYALPSNVELVEIPFTVERGAGTRSLEAALPEAAVYHSAATGVPGVLATRVATARGRGSIVTEHGVSWDEARRGMPGMCKGGIPGWVHHRVDQLPGGHARSEWAELNMRLAQEAYAAADLVTGVSPWTVRLQRSLGAHTSLLENGVRLGAAAAPAVERPAGDRPRIGFVGRVAPVKDLLTLIRAARIVADEVPEVEVAIVGPLHHHPLYAERCVEEARRLGLEGTVTFVGEDDPQRWYPLFDVLALTSVSEAQPLVALEAMAAGVPVVATAVGGCPELIGGTGLLTAARDPRGTARALTRLLSDPVLRAHAGAAGRSKVEASHGLDATLAGYGRLYERAAERTAQA